MQDRLKHIVCVPYALIITFLLISGCEKPTPVELRDDEIPSPEVELINEPTNPLLDTKDVDSTKLFPPEPRRTLGHMLISGSVYDGLLIHNEATLARAIFFDRSSPILNDHGDTVTYNTYDVGDIFLDEYALRKHPKHFVSQLPPIDSLLGIQYSLLNTDSTGITYTGNFLYRWQSLNINPFEQFEVTLISPEQIVVTSPTPSGGISLAHNLPVKWTGGGAAVKIIISDISQPESPRPLVHLRVRSNRGEVIIPATILRLLPRNRLGFLFTVSSGTSKIIRINGYPDDVLVQATTNHSLYLRVSR